MLNEKKSVRREATKQNDVEEMLKTFMQLPTAEQEKLFYMMKGVELMVQQLPERKAV